MVKKNFTTRTPKKNQTQASATANNTPVEKETPVAEPVQTNTSGEAPEQTGVNGEPENLEQQHKDFKASLVPVQTDDNITPPDLTPKLEQPKVTSVMDVATEHNAYVGDQRTTTNQNPPPPVNNQLPPGNNNPPPPGSDPPPPPGGNAGFQATPPPSDPTDAPEQPPPPPPGATPGDPFTIPAGTAEEVIDWGFNLVNYGIKEFGPYAVAMKFSKGFYAKLPEKLALETKSLVKSTATKNAARLVFTPEEQNMIKKPLAKGMNEAGVRGLTWKEELLAVSLIVGAKKATVIGEIRSENRTMAEKIEANLEKYYKPEPPPKQEANENPNPEKNEHHDASIITDVKIEEEIPK